MQLGAPAALVALGFLLRPLDALVLSRGTPLADVYGMDAAGKPMGDDDHRDQTVELLRFVTAYGTGIETLVDLTPYSPLLEAGRASDKGLSMYSFIDTWVNNDTGTDAMYMHNITEQCYPIARSYGNGWSLSAELVFWGGSSSGRETAPVRPKHSVTLSSGFYGGDFDFGRVAVHSAKLASHGGSVLLERAVDFEGAEHAQVYECRQGMAEMEYAARMGFLAQQVEVSVRKDGNTTAAEKLMNQTYQNMAMDEFVVFGTATTDPEGDHGNRSLVLEYNPDEAELEVGMPVYFRPGDVFTDQEMQTGVWWNLTYPFKRVGKINALTNTTASVFLESGCIPTNKTKLGSVVPRLMSPRSKKALPELRAILRTVGNYAVERASMPPPSDPLAAAGISEVQLLLPYREDANRTTKEAAAPGDFLFSLGHDEDDHVAGFSVQAPKMIGTVPLQRAGNTAEAPIEAEEGANETVGGVCVLEQRRQGRLFERSFRLDDLARGEDVVVLQLTVTGHGWASTTEQCGEYCHALYQLRFNGKLAHNISEFRNDCKENPVGVNTTQIGTWWESRNGWCPGSVEPGIFVDVTKWLRKGKNHLAVDALVWSEVTKSYELYTDLSGFAFKDAASLAIGLNLFVYGADAVAAARAKDPSTPAEFALKNGVGGRGQLDPTGPPVTEEGVVQLTQKRPTSELLQLTSVVDVQARTAQLRAARARAPPGAREGQTRPQPPWYFLNSSVPEQVKASQIEEGSLRIPVMVTELMQGARRVVYARLEAADIPKDWDSVAVHFKLDKPPGNLSIDHWDRVGSFGLKLPATQTPEGIGLHTERQPLEREKWVVTGVQQS